MAEPDERPPLAASAPPFELERELGHGAVGEVWLARLTAPAWGLAAGEPLAVKLLRPGADHERGRAALERELSVARAVEHPALARVHQAGLCARGPYLALELVPGATLRERLAQGGPLPEDALRAIGADLAGALAALHAAGWIHGDVKPENVRLRADGRAVLLDLGLALRRDEDPRAARSGTLPYLAPEQTQGGRATPASDVFALGILLHECSTGRHPFPPGDGADAERWLASIRRGGEVLPSRIRPELSPLFDAVVREALATTPAARPAAAVVGEVLARGEASEWWHAIAARDEGRARTPDLRGVTPFAGRSRELAELDEAWAEARRGHGRLIWLEGPFGMGKARLVDTFVRRARSRPGAPLVLRERSTVQEEERGEHPVRVLLRQFLGLARHEVPGPSALARLRELLPHDVAASLAAALGAVPDAPSVRPIAESTALARWLLALGRERPLVVSLEGVDSAGATTLDVLARVAEDLARTSLLLIVSVRGGELPASADGGRAARLAGLAGRANLRLALGPLSEDEVLGWVLQLFGSNTPRRRLARVLHERSGGSPASLSEVLAGLRSRAQVRTTATGRLELSIPPEEIHVPASLRRSILERIEELDPRERAWLERCAVLSSHLERPFLARVYPDASPAELDGVLAALRESGWLVPYGSRFRFARATVRDAVYESIPPARRDALHAEAARALGEIAAERSSASLSFHRAQHLRAGGRQAEVLAEIQPLLDDPRVVAAAGQALTLARYGLEALDVLPESDERARLRLRLLELAADSADRLGARDDQRRFLDQLSRLALDPDRDPGAVARVYLLHGQYATSVGQYGLSRGWLGTAADLFARAGQSDAQGLALLRLAYVQGHLGQLAEAERLAQASLDLAADDLGRARALTALATVSLVRDEYELTLRWIDRALQHLRAARDASSAMTDFADTYLLQSRTYRLVGRPRRAFAALERARRHAAHVGDRRLEVEAGARLGRLLLDANQPAEAELELREARITAREIEYRRGEALASLFLGTLLAEGDDPEAPSVLERTTGVAHELGLGRVEALARALRARIALQRGLQDEAERLSRAAFELFEPLGGELSDRIVIAATRSLVLLRGGRREEADALAGELERRVRRVNERIQAPILRQRHRRAAFRLLAASLTSEGPVYPRMALRLRPPPAR